MHEPLFRWSMPSLQISGIVVVMKSRCLRMIDTTSVLHVDDCTASVSILSTLYSDLRPGSGN